MIHIRKSSNNQFYFTVNGKNGKVLVTSETYIRKGSVIKGILALGNVLDASKKILDHTKTILNGKHPISVIYLKKPSKFKA